ncbi:MAG: GNAT family N-acetyltransferase [Clostridiales bacterium]|nr:GNAT family N-acetyltransferase [Clostridiales bacterium]
MKNIGTQEITTQRLLLRKIKLEDAEPLLFSGSLSGTLDTARKNIENYIEEYNLSYTYHWVIDYDNKPIGRVLAWDVSLRDEYCQLGYDISQEFCSQGFMTEAIKAVLLYLLTKADFHRVYCSVRVPNIASNKVCQKAGMILDGTLRKHYKCNNGYDDVNIYSFIKDDL